MTPKVWLLVFALAGVSAAACSSRRAPEEHLGMVSSALFANGVPCASADQCTSNNCIDGVCCNTACGGGVRDLLTCSNVYGAVNGLVDGTCGPLTVGDACGSLTTVNPCSWRGTLVNNGNNCPNPPGGSSACFPCGTSADCSGAFPVCADGSCVQCSGDNGSPTPAPCPASAPTCSAGLCVQCTVANQASCTGTTPACDTATGLCAGCNGDNGSGATRACSTAAARACRVDGSCGVCSATNATACVGTTPACDTGTGTCAACTGDLGSGMALACPTAANPYCFAAGANAGACGKCTVNGDCAGHPAGAFCNTVTGACGAGCMLDAECAAGTEWCAAGVCTAKVANGQPLPATAPINGTCSVANGTRVCASGRCDTNDNLCGLPNGATCGPPATSASCRSGACFAGDNKCGLPAGEDCTLQADCRSLVCSASGKCGNCQADATCGVAASGQVCGDLDKTCRAGCRGTGGNTCPAGKVCTSTTAAIGQCVQCLVDTTCGGATSGMICDATTSTCKAGCRGSDGNGCPVGQTCSSGDGTIGVCTQCSTDLDCGNATSGQICNDAKICQAGCRGTDGNGCPAAQLCTSTDKTVGTCQTPGVDAGPVDSGGGCTADPDCGGPTSGRLCDQASKTCVDGCRGEGGNGCAQGQACTSTSTSAGVCAPPPASAVDDAILEGGGLACSTTTTGAGGDGGLALMFLGASLALTSARRRRRVR